MTSSRSSNSESNELLNKIETSESNELQDKIETIFSVLHVSINNVTVQNSVIAEGSLRERDVGSSPRPVLSMCTAAVSSYSSRLTQSSMCKDRNSTKKRSKFWSFMTKGKSPTKTLALGHSLNEGEDENECGETTEGSDSWAPDCPLSDALRFNVNSSSPLHPRRSNSDRSVLGARLRSTGLSLPTALPVVVVEATELTAGVREVPGSSSTLHGYQHVGVDRTLSSSSSSSTSSSCPINVTDHSVAHSLVSTIYPQINSILPGTVGLQSDVINPIILTNHVPSMFDRNASTRMGLHHPEPSSSSSAVSQTIHTQVDYMHCLVPDLLALTNSSFYWGVMDRYEAEQLLDNRPEGTFLVRDSAQNEFIFSVSFRRYGRSLHARIEQWNHRFSFDSHDLAVFYAPTVCGLIEHYKDPNCCMFFEPMLTLPLRRTSPFALQHLCRALVTSRVTYDDINTLTLPKSLHEYLKYYHYKQRICVRRF